MLAELALDFVKTLFRLDFPAMDDQPARAFRDPRPEEKNNEAERRTDEKGEPPTGVGGESGGIEYDERSSRPKGGTNPERAIDGKVGPAAIARWYHLLYRGIHSAVFAADPSAGQHPEQTKAFQIPGASGGCGRHEIDTQCDKK